MKTVFKECLISEVCHVFSGNSINEKQKADNYTNIVEGTPYIATKDVGYDFKINYENGIKIPTSALSKFKVAPKDSVFICAEGGSAGRKLAISNREVCFVNKLFALVANEKVLPKYLYYCLQDIAFAKKFKQATTGLIGGVSLNKFKSLTIHVPDISTQEKIVKKIDAAFVEIERMADLTKNNIESASKLVSNYLEIQIATASKECPTVRLGEACDSVEYGTSAKSTREGKVPVIRMGNLSNGNIDFSDLVFTSDEDEIKKYSLNAGDVLFNRTNSPVHVGKTAIFKGGTEAIFAGYLIRVNYKKNLVIPEYLNLYLNSERIRNYGFTVMSHSINQANINGSKLKEYPFVLPSLEKQKEIATEVGVLSEEAASLQKIYEAKLLNLAALKTSILTKAFVGELMKV